MNVLGISGSPCPDGNTALLLKYFLDGALSRGAEINIINLADLDIAACQACNDCAVTAQCRINDDMDLLYKEMERADVIALASPLHFMSVTAQTKLMIDRCQVCWARKNRLGLPSLGTTKLRRGIFISAGGRKDKHLFDAARITVRALFASLDARYYGELLCPGLNEHAAIKGKPDILKQAFDMGAGLFA
jgi:multimeric flavodoxin WrbA